jgi:hypothetical protein
VLHSFFFFPSPILHSSTALFSVFILLKVSKIIQEWGPAGLVADVEIFCKKVAFICKLSFDPAFEVVLKGERRGGEDIYWV